MTLPQAIGDYTVLEQIGSGGFGAVFLVERDGKRYACKQLYASMVNAEIQERFAREALKIEELRRDFQLEYLVKVTDVLLPHNAFVMEHLPESGVAYYNRTRDPRFLGRLVHGVLQLHKIDVVHRDIKPENIRVRGDIPVLIDFGITSWWDSKSHILPGGTKHYSPPEIIAMFPQFRGLEASQSACRHLVNIAPDNVAQRLKQVKKIHDVYSLGMTIGVFLTGKLPFTEESYRAYLHAGTCPDFEAWIDAMPEPYDKLVRLATTFHPDERPDVSGLLNEVELDAGGVTAIPDRSVVFFTEAPYRCLDCGGTGTGPDGRCPTCEAPYSRIRLRPDPPRTMRLTSEAAPAVLVRDSRTSVLEIDMTGPDREWVIGRSGDKVDLAFEDDHWMSRRHGRLVKVGDRLIYTDGVDGRMPSHLSALNNVPIGTGRAELSCGSFLTVGSTVLAVEKFFGTGNGTGEDSGETM